MSLDTQTMNPCNQALHTSDRILVADDHDGVRDVVTDLLHKWGFSVEVASDGVECVSRFRDGDIDMVITNFLMPGLNGLEVCRTIRSLNSSVPLILMSGYALDDLSQHNAFDLVSGYLPKPFSSADLGNLIEKVRSEGTGISAAAVGLGERQENSEIENGEIGNGDATTSQKHRRKRKG